MDGRACGGDACSVYPPRLDRDQGRVRRLRRRRGRALRPRRRLLGGAGRPGPVAPVDAEARDPTTTGILPDLPPTLCPPPPPAAAPPAPDPPPRPSRPAAAPSRSPITVWQIWNEQNSPKYFAPEGRRRAATRRCSKRGRRRSARSTRAPRSSSAACGGRQSAKKVVVPTKPYLEKLYALAGRGQLRLDRDPPLRQQRARPRSRSSRRARESPKRPATASAGIWVTEIGWAAGGPTDNPYVKGLKGQARAARRALTAFKRKQRSFKLRGVFWYSWRDKKGGDVDLRLVRRTPACGRRTAPRSPPGGRSSGRPRGERADRTVGSRRSPRSLCLALAAAAPRAAAAAPKRVLRRRCRRAPLDDRRLRRDGRRRASARCASSSIGRAIDPSRGRRLRLVVAGRDRRRARPRNGVRPLPFVVSTPALGGRASTATLRARRLPAYAPEGSDGAGRLAGVPRRRGRPLRPGRRVLGREPDPARSCRSATGRSGTSRTRRASRSRSRTSRPTRSCSTPRTRRSPRRGPGREIILGGMFGTPLGGRKPALAAWDFLAQALPQKGAKRDFDGVAPHPYAAKFTKVLAQIELLRDEMRARGRRRGRALDHRDRLGLGRAAEPAQPGPAGQAERLEEAFKYFVEKRKRAQHRERRPGTRGGTTPRPRRGLCEWCPSRACSTEDRSAKPSLDAFTEFTGGS